MTQSATGWSFAQFGCADIFNDARTVAYHRWACAEDLWECDSIPDPVDACYCELDGVPEDYTDPITDEVCWYDPQIPESAEFLGVLVRKPVGGARDSTWARAAVDSVRQGSVLQRPQLRGKSFGFEVVFIGTSCAGVEYGIEWLRRTLELGGCDSGDQCQACLTRSLCARIYCDDGAPEDNGFRQWVEVGLTDGLSEVAGDGMASACCCVRVYTFSMTSQRPQSFTVVDEPTTLVADDEEFQACYDWTLGCVNCGSEHCITCTDCGEPLDSCELCRNKCGPCDRCGFDPVCGVATVRPVAPVFVDQDDCIVCEPIAKVVQCFEVTNLDAQVDSTFVIDLFSGFDLENPVFQERGLRNAAVRIFQNPQQIDPITDQESYNEWLRRDPCAELRVRYVPANATIRIDGKAERVSLICDGNCRPFEQVVVGPSSAAIFPIAAACYDLMICVEWDSYQTQFRVEDPVAVPSQMTVQRYRRWRN